MLEKRSIITKKNIFQILCIISLLFSIVAMLIAKSSPAIGYESSIYKSTPIIVWISIFSLMITGLIIIMYYILYEKLYQSRLWLVGLFLIFLSYTICISLYIIRGYFMWAIGGDPATHIGYINQIISNGYLPAQLFYPMLHIYVSQLFFVSNVDLITLHKILPLIFGILYILFIYILSKYALPEKSQIILSTIAGSTLINGWYLNLTPNALSNLYFPLSLFILLKVISSKNVRWELLVLVIAFFYPLFHPIPVLALLIIICTLSLPNYIFAKINSSQLPKNKNNRFLRAKITLIVLLLVWSLTWVSSFYIWDRMVQNIYSLIAEDEPSSLSSLINQINYAKGYGYNVTELILKSIGGPLVYTLITIVSFPIIFKIKDREKLNNLFSLYGPFLFLCLFVILLYFLNLDFGPLRVITYITMISTLFVGYLLNYLLKKLKVNFNVKIEHRGMFIFSFVGLIFLLFLVWINGILVLYPSPYTLESNLQTTSSEIEGMNWLFETKNLDLEITGMTLVPFRYADFLLTSEQKKLQKLHYWDKPEYLTIPFHFGYDNNTLLSDYYNQSIYLDITEKDKLIYTDVFPKMAEIRWTPQDFEKLNDDISLKKIYSNKKFEIFYIDGLGKV